MGPFLEIWRKKIGIKTLSEGMRGSFLEGTIVEDLLSLVKSIATIILYLVVLSFSILINIHFFIVDYSVVPSKNGSPTPLK